MTKPALYTITTGLSGCYMPDDVSAPQSYATRRELAEAIRGEIDVQDFPKSAIRQAPLRRIWRQVAARGSSSAHFSIQHKGREIAFHGLTQAEFDEASNED